MSYEIIEKLGDGAFGDVYKFKDSRLGREVAIKFFRGANAAVSNALDHARALARVNHQNVVTIYSIETMEDPSTKDEVDCVVMELVNGETLEQRLSGPKFSMGQLREFGKQLLDGLSHIHGQGLVHNDLNPSNIMITGDGLKIIDILYRGTLAAVAPEVREDRVQHDLRSLRVILGLLIHGSEIDPSEATAFNHRLSGDPNIESIRDSFEYFTNPELARDLSRLVDHAYRRVTDDHFVEDQDYASALSEDTQDRVVLPLLEKIIENRAYNHKQSHYVRALWSRLGTEGRAKIAGLLSEALEADTPGGNWWPNLSIVCLLSRNLWGELSAVVRIKLESLIVNDILSGRHDIYSRNNNSGALGTYAVALWPYFRSIDRLVNNIESMLTSSWYTQNYIGNHFMGVLPQLALSEDQHKRIIAALKVAEQHDARLVKNNLSLLPGDWVEEIYEDFFPEYS